PSGGVAGRPAPSREITSPEETVWRRPSLTSRTSRPASSSVSKVPLISRSESRTRIDSPRPAARASQSVRMVEKCSPRFHWATRPSIFTDSVRKSFAAVTFAPAAAMSVAGKSVLAGWLLQLAPMPTATAPSAKPSRSTRMPANFLPASSRSFGHLIASFGFSATATSATASCTASAATSDSSGQCSAGPGSVRSSVANRLPRSETQARPWRPRPALWRSATIHKGPRSPARAGVSASALVEVRSSCATSRTPATLALGSSCMGSEQRLRRDGCRLDQGSGIDEEQQVEQPARAQHRLQLAGHRLERLGRLVEIHDLDDHEIIIGADYAGEHAEHRQRKQPGLDRGEEHIEFREKSGERGNAGEREQQHRQEKCHRRLGAREAGKIADVLHQPAVAAHRQDASKGAERHGHIDRHVDEHALHPFGGAGG